VDAFYASTESKDTYFMATVSKIGILRLRKSSLRELLLRSG